MKIIHYSDKTLGSIYSTNPGDPGSGWQKPKGLWVSAETGNEDGWKEWCQSENFRGDESFAVASEIILAPNSNVLRIEHAPGLINFTQKYQTDKNVPHYMRKIDWARVGDAHQGIVIAPYLWECRLSDETFWYYAWDCASGCIWDANAVAEVRITQSG